MNVQKDKKICLNKKCVKMIQTTHNNNKKHSAGTKGK